jgi:hypothetical protein
VGASRGAPAEYASFAKRLDAIRGAKAEERQEASSAEDDEEALRHPYRAQIWGWVQQGDPFASPCLRARCMSGPNAKGRSFGGGWRESAYQPRARSPVAAHLLRFLVKIGALTVAAPGVSPSSLSCDTALLRQPHGFEGLAAVQEDADAPDLALG